MQCALLKEDSLWEAEVVARTAPQRSHCSCLGHAWGTPGLLWDLNCMAEVESASFLHAHLVRSWSWGGLGAWMALCPAEQLAWQAWCGCRKEDTNLNLLQVQANALLGCET
jgi:hypothetical protein